MLQGQEKSYSIVDTNPPFTGFSCCPFPGEGEAEILLGGAQEGLFLLTLSQLVSASPPSEHPEIAGGCIAQMAEEKWSNNCHTLLQMGLLNSR